MPARDEIKVRKSARNAGLRPGSKQYNAYVYDTMRKIKARRAKKRRGK